MPKPTVIVIGAGPGGLTAAMILAARGYAVTVLEKQPVLGGRNAKLHVNGYTFELGPTFVMLPEAFHDAFVEAGKNMSDYLDLKTLEPMYRLRYASGTDFHVYYDKERFKAEIERTFPGESAGYERYLRDHKIKFERLYRCLTVPYMRWYTYLRLKLLKALPYVGLTSSVHDVLSHYFRAEDLKIAMAFQAKYLGMSPWKCPGGFSILSYIEHAKGIYHPMGGVHKVSEALARAAREGGADIRLGTAVREITFDGMRATGVILESGERMTADAVIMNADFAHGMTTLVPAAKRTKYSDAKLAKKGYSCSTFMVYLGVDKTYDLPHHSIIFSADYRKNTVEIYDDLTLSADPSFYVQNASATDPSLAPEGCSTIYVLVPVPNTDAQIDWAREKQAFRDLIIGKLAERAGFEDIREHIVAERVITPADWQDMGVYKGAVFNLAHSLDQMLYLRPHNRLEGYSRLYLVGGGTHPGSGLPTIIESGRISARLVEEDVKMV